MLSLCPITQCSLPSLEDGVPSCTQKGCWEVCCATLERVTVLTEEQGTDRAPKAVIHGALRTPAAGKGSENMSTSQLHPGALGEPLAGSVFGEKKKKIP